MTYTLFILSAALHNVAVFLVTAYESPCDYGEGTTICVQFYVSEGTAFGTVFGHLAG